MHDAKRTNVKNISQRVAAITGAGSGIGRGLALALGKRGGRLALSDIDEAGLAQTAQLVQAQGGTCECTKVDVANREQVHAWADATMAKFGAVNLVFNNAGVAQGGTVEGNTYAEYEWVMNINFWGVVYGTKAFLPHLKATGTGHIVNISSVFGLFSQPTQSAYNASKFAVRGFTESLRLELDIMKCGVSASSVHPGGIKTSIAKRARMNASAGEILGVTPEQAQAAIESRFRTTPEQAAETILRGVQRDARRVLIGVDAWGFDSMARLVPAGYQRLMGELFERRAKHSAH